MVALNQLVLLEDRGAVRVSWSSRDVGRGSVGVGVDRVGVVAFLTFPIGSVDPINLGVVAVVPSLVALADDPVVFGWVGLRQERHSVVVHRDGAVGGDVDFLAILHGVEEVAAELVDGDDLGVVPDVSQDDARC